MTEPDPPEQAVLRRALGELAAGPAPRQSDAALVAYCRRQLARRRAWFCLLAAVVAWFLVRGGRA